MEYIDECILALRHKKTSSMGIKTKEKAELFFVKTTGNGELTMSLDMLENHEPLEKALEQSRQLFRLLYPGSVIYKKGEEA